MPRDYCLGQRQIGVDQNRASVIAAARKLLSARRGTQTFSMDVVAKAAGVAKMTLYHQFGSKRELLEALFDDLGGRGLAPFVPSIFEAGDSLEALERFVGVFANFWTTERLVIRRVNALAAIDADFAESLAGRDERRRMILTNVLRRVAEEHGCPSKAEFDNVLRMVFTLTSFQTFDALAGKDRTPTDVAPAIHRLVLATIGLPSAASVSQRRRRRSASR